MGDITESKRRHYVGTDADKDTIPAGGKSKGDSYHANDKGKQYYWNGANWKTGLGYEFVPRAPNAWDKQIGDFTTDGTWKVNGLDISGIVPAGAVAVMLRLQISDDAAGSAFWILSAAGTAMAEFLANTQAAGMVTEVHGVISISADRLLDYKGSNLAFTTINLAVLGWFI